MDRHMKKLLPSLAVMMTAVLIAGCTVGPNYHRPAVQTPATYRDLGENTQVQPQVASYADLPGGRFFRIPNCRNSSARR